VGFAIYFVTATQRDVALKTEATHSSFDSFRRALFSPLIIKMADVKFNNFNTFGKSTLRAVCGARERER
jgi:hypothetical protein